MKSGQFVMQNVPCLELKSAETAYWSGKIFIITIIIIFIIKKLN